MWKALILFLLLTLSFSGSAKPIILYVAANGNDGWSGRLDKPAQDAKDGPLATLPAALRAARAARQNTNDSPDGISVLLRGGTYSVSEPVVLTPADSGSSSNQPFTIAAYQDEIPVLSGGRSITGWKKVEGKPGLWEAEVPEVREGRWYFRQLFINGKRQRRARMPNSGFYQINGDYLSNDPVQFKFHPGDIKREWIGDNELEIVALQKWVDFRQHIKSIDPVSNIVTLSGLVSEHTTERNARYYIENTPDALDQAGEWYLDRKRGVVRYRAELGEDLNGAETVGSALTSELIRFEGDFAAKRSVQQIVLRGLVFAYTDWALDEKGHTDSQAAAQIRGDILAQGAVDCVIENCTFAHLGGYALELGKGCQRWRVVGNEFVDIGAGGIRVGEPSKRKEVFEQNWGNVITDNHLHQLGRVYAPAIGVIVFQSGQNRVAHNHIHDLYYTALSIGWNWGYQETPCRENIIEFNHLHDIGQGILSDMGAVYTLGIQKGTVVRNNLIHDVNAHSYGGWGLYTDEGSSDIVLENNVVYRCKSATFHQHYGRDNVIRNNILAFGTEHQIMRSREEEHLSFIFTNNIVYFVSGDLLGSTWGNNNFQMDANVYWDARPADSAATVQFKNVTLAEWRKRGHDAHSIIADPLFVAPEKFDFRLQPNSPALKLGFKPIDLQEVGVRKKFKKQVRDPE